jgi:hypothetical protein
MQPAISEESQMACEAFILIGNETIWREPKMSEKTMAILTGFLNEQRSTTSISDVRYKWVREKFAVHLYQEAQDYG